jgi:predicted nucleic acid-binding protein
VFGELRRKIRDEIYFASRISEAEIVGFIDLLRGLSVWGPIPGRPIPRWTRDPNDDVLVANALEAGVDYLISGDKDLLALGDSIPPLKIRSPQAFLDEVGQEPDGGIG